MQETRVFRAWGASLVVALCGTGAHLLAGGDMAAWASLLVLAATWPVAYAAAGGRLSTGQLLGLLLLGQLTVHLVAGHDAGSGATMLLAHGVATALSLLLVRRGEDAWWRVADALRVVLQRLVPWQRLPLVCVRTPLAASEGWVPRLRTLIRGVGGRAPPAAV